MEIKMQTKPIALLRKIRPLAGGFAFSLLLFVFVQTASAFTKTGTVYTTDGSQADVMAAEANASVGDEIDVPAGTFAWGTGFVAVNLYKSETLKGAGQGQTIINLVNGGPSNVYGAIQFYSAGRVTGMTINGYGQGYNAVPFAAQSGNGWRIDHVTYDATDGGTDADGGYLIYVNYCYGLIDDCKITGGSGTDELIFSRAPADSWQTPDSYGTTNALYVENNYFGGQGYVCDINSYGRAVLRFNMISGNLKIDGHGKTSNTPARGVRQMEIYGNIWTNTSYVVELRGGTGMVFGNTSIGTAWWILDEYGCLAQWPNFGNVYQTPADYPIDDQIGVGEDPKVAASDPYYLWNNTNGGTLMLNVSSLTWKSIPTGAIEQYTNETRNPNSTFTMQDIIKSDRDYFIQTNNFNGSSGIGVGTYAQMEAITPSHTNVAFWVTDRGYWNTLNTNSDGTTNTSGELYVWNGSSWNFDYEPYAYPYTSVSTPQGTQMTTPILSPGAGPFTNSITVTMTTAMKGATINYTTDGSTPSDNYGTQYTSPITFTSTTTVKAIAFKAGYLDSTIGSGTFTIVTNLPSPPLPMPPTGLKPM